VPSTNLLELSPWNHEPASVGAWIWETAAREGPWGIRQTACRALPLARLAVAAQEQVEWLPILEMMRHTYEGKHLTTEVRCARDELPFVERVPFPSDARLVRYALSNAAPADLDAGFALAMGVMLEAEDIMVRDENGELDPPGPGRPELRPAAIWQTGEACALVALERAGIEEGEIAKHLVHASILLDPEAPPSEVIRDERRVEQHAAALADLIRARFPRATL